MNKIYFVSIWHLKSLHFTCSHLFVYVSSHIAICCYLLLFAIPCFHLLLLFFISCYSLYHSLWFITPLVIIHCHSLYHSLSLVITLCTTLLTFYKRSLWECIEKSCLITSIISLYLRKIKNLWYGIFNSNNIYHRWKFISLCFYFIIFILSVSFGVYI